MATDRGYDYARWWYAQQAHRARFKRYVEANGVTCQSCGGRGESGRSAYEPGDPCGWCETTGKMTKRSRGEYLTYMRSLRNLRKRAS
jgi:hypothetical protein